MLPTKGVINAFSLHICLLIHLSRSKNLKVHLDMSYEVEGSTVPASCMQEKAGYNFRVRPVHMCWWKILKQMCRLEWQEQLDSCCIHLLQSYWHGLEWLSVCLTERYFLKFLKFYVKIGMSFWERSIIFLQAMILCTCMQDQQIEAVLCIFGSPTSECCCVWINVYPICEPESWLYEGLLGAVSIFYARVFFIVVLLYRAASNCPLR